MRSTIRAKEETLITVILAWIVFAEWPGLWTWVGGTVIFASTVYITQREAKAKKSIRPNAGLRETKL